MDGETNEIRHQAMIRINFKQQSKAAEFNPTTMLYHTCGALKKADPSMQVFAKQTAEEIDIENGFPESKDELLEKFLESDHSGPRAALASISFTICVNTAQSVNHIKHNDPELMQFLQQNRILIRYDNYAGGKIVVVGSLYNIAVRLYNRDAVKNHLDRSMQAEAKLLTDSDVSQLSDEILDNNFKCNKIENQIQEFEQDSAETETEWKSTNQPKKKRGKHDKHQEDEEMADTLIDFSAGVKIPVYNIIVSTKYASKGKTKISADVLDIQCAAESQELLNLLLGKVVMRNKIPHEGIYLPRAFSRTNEEKDNFFNLLVTQHNYAADTMALFVKNINHDVLSHEFDYEHEHVIHTRTLDQLIMSHGSVQEIIPTKFPTTVALICKRDHMNAVREMVDNEVPKVFNKAQIPEDLWVNGQVPMRNNLSKESKSSITYSQVLSNYSTTPDIISTKRTASRTPKIQPTYNLDKSSFPSLQRKAPKPSPAEPQHKNKKAKTTVGDETAPAHPQANTKQLAQPSNGYLTQQDIDIALKKQDEEHKRQLAQRDEDHKQELAKRDEENKQQIEAYKQLLEKRDDENKQHLKDFLQQQWDKMTELMRINSTIEPSPQTGWNSTQGMPPPFGRAYSSPQPNPYSNMYMGYQKYEPQLATMEPPGPSPHQTQPPIEATTVKISGASNQ